MYGYWNTFGICECKIDKKKNFYVTQYILKHILEYSFVSHRYIRKQPDAYVIYNCVEIVVGNFFVKPNRQSVFFFACIIQFSTHLMYIICVCVMYCRYLVYYVLKIK